MRKLILRASEGSYWSLVCLRDQSASFDRDDEWGDAGDGAG